VLTAARADLSSLPVNSTVILDAVCPYEGPAVVFETSWDVGGALTLALGRRTFGDAVSERMSVGEKGLESSIYKAPSFYPYGPGLYVYNVMEHLVVPLPDRGAAINYFGKHPWRDCPGFVARGVEVYLGPMTLVRFLKADGTLDKEVEAKPGQRLLDVAWAAREPLEGACEGVMACSTCHVIVDAQDFEKLPPASEEEEDLLDLAAHATRTSRLACQIILTEEMRSLEVRIPSGATNWMGR
jgi:ferredoxin